MKIYKVDFDPVWPVPSGLIIAAENEKQAGDIASYTVRHTHVKSVVEVPIDVPKVIFYESGEY